MGIGRDEKSLHTQDQNIQTRSLTHKDSCRVFSFLSICSKVFYRARGWLYTTHKRTSMEKMDKSTTQNMHLVSSAIKTGKSIVPVDLNSVSVPSFAIHSLSGATCGVIINFQTSSLKDLATVPFSKVSLRLKLATDHPFSSWTRLEGPFLCSDAFSAVSVTAHWLGDAAVVRNSGRVRRVRARRVRVRGVRVRRVWIGTVRIVWGVGSKGRVVIGLTCVFMTTIAITAVFRDAMTLIMEVTTKLWVVQTLVVRGSIIVSVADVWSTASHCTAANYSQYRNYCLFFETTKHKYGESAWYHRWCCHPCDPCLPERPIVLHHGQIYVIVSRI